MPEMMMTRTPSRHASLAFERSSAIAAFRIAPRYLILLVAAVIVVSACSSSDAGRPPTGVSDLNLATDHAGCEVSYGNEPAQIVGPIRRTDTAVVELSEDSKALIGNSPLTLHITVFRGRTQAKESVNWSDVPSSGFVMEDVWIDSAHLGYTITCWRG